MEKTVLISPRAVEAFSVSHVEVEGTDLYGVRDYALSEAEPQDVRFLDDPESSNIWIEISTGYAQSGDLSDGSVLLVMPSRDFTGKIGKLFMTIPRVENWKVLLHDGGYKRGWTYTYRGIVTDARGRLEFVYDDDLEKTRHLISANAYIWPGRSKEILNLVVGSSQNVLPEEVDKPEQPM